MLPQRAPAQVPRLTPFETFAWDNAVAIMVADYLRVLSLVLGLAIAAMYLRLAFVDRRCARQPGRGARARTGAVVLLAATSCMYQFDRINDPVTVLLPLNFAGLALAVYGLYHLPHKPPVNAPWLLEEDDL